MGVSCRDFVPPEKAWPFQVVQVGGIAEKPRAFGRMPPTMHESTKHPQRGRRPVSIDQFPKINGSGIPDSLPFHKKYVARPQIKFSDRPLFQKGSPGAGRGALQRAMGYRAGSPARKAGLPGRSSAKSAGDWGRRLWKECFLGGTHSFGSTA